MNKRMTESQIVVVFKEAGSGMPIKDISQRSIVILFERFGFSFSTSDSEATIEE